MTITLETVRDEDLDEAILLLKDLYMELGEETESVQFLNHQLLDELRCTGLTQILFIKTETSVADIITLTTAQAIYAGGKYGVIDELYIKPEFRSQNIGTVVLDRVKEMMADMGWKRIDVTAPTDDKWTATINFYRKSGFQFTGSKFKIVA